ncbi:uncharacterized protein RCC_00594 [Ramularia collo-cygni]|uniref:Uncharacterized protein n=1 Tax=Ramularia collo-cygni TaxID=112498 RepID=A0A2D3ULD9_9PEZI|nr:uncharacterized protein RCC_00594 [Ramularia collo-cygni]CZT14622.1 uncharacterized protein RCC_00594 [Ramularia collo-cygni]
MTPDMTNVVEASSLSAVTDIATNPPPHAHAPTHLPPLPLILYIARVPGSRDVFLTPMKPREKVVTAEDVQSSLYYVHVNGDETGDKLASVSVSSVNTNASQLLSGQENGVRRKPLLPQRHMAPLTPPYPIDDEDMSTWSRTSPVPQKPNRIARKPISSNSSNSCDQNGRGLPSRPLPSPPHDEEPCEPYDTSLHASKMHLLYHSDHTQIPNPYSSPVQPIEALPERHPSGSLTLIRRDPSSNEQWNVASIHDPPIPEVSSAALRNPSAAKRTKRGGAPVYLDISNPAYAQFIDTNNQATSRDSFTSSNSAESDPPPEGIFRRRLHMPGSQYGEHTYTRSSRPVSAFASSEEILNMRRTIRSSAMDSSTDVPTSTAAAVDDRKGKGYTFTSPWDGRCEFTTGAAGKSLKCRHILPQDQHHHHLNPRSPNDEIVSELRFNLPTSNKTATPVQEKRKSHLRGLLVHRRQKSSSEDHHAGGDDEEEEKMDLTLGQERAGGGFRGKEAKLGKLIIEPSGLGMLDLLVAANVALWWRAYERY